MWHPSGVSSLTQLPVSFTTNHTHLFGHGLSELSHHLSVVPLSTPPRSPYDTALLRVVLPDGGGDDPMFSMQRGAMMPRGMVDEGGCMWAPLAWDGSSGRPTFSPQLRMMLCLAAARSMAELFAALSVAGGEDEVEEEDDGGSLRGDMAVCDPPEMPPPAWALLAASCDADLAQLETAGGRGASPAGEGSGGLEQAYWPFGAAEVAIRARRELVLAVAEVAKVKAPA